MAITITTALSANVAAFSPVTLAGTTKRNPFSSSGARHSQTVTAYNESFGFVRAAVASSGDFVEGDTVLITGASGDFAYINGRQEVTGVAAGYITLALAWVAGTTGDKGTIYRMNEGLSVRADVLNESAEVVAQLYSSVDPLDSSWEFDLSKALQSELFSEFTLATGQVECFGAAHEYTVKLYDVFLSPAYASTSYYDEALTDPTTIAHRTTLYSSDYVSGLLLLNGRMIASDKVCLHFITDKGDDTRLSIRPFTGGIEGTTVNYTITENIHGHRQYTFETPTCDYFLLSVEWYDTESTSWVTIKSAITVKIAKSCSTVLYFTNRLGGFESYEFTDYDDNQLSDKIEQFTAEAWKERTLEGVTYGGDFRQSIRDLITSHEVYDESGTLVEVLTDTLVYKSKEVNPIIKIRYDETFIS